MANGISKSIFVLNYTSLIGWVLMLCGAAGLIFHLPIIRQDIFQVTLLSGIILIMGSRFLRWIFNI